jgi:hypothetical protein
VACSGHPATSSDAPASDVLPIDAMADAAIDAAPKMWSQVAYIKASNTGSFDYFGTTLAISADGTTLAVAAPGEFSGNPIDPTDNTKPEAGAVYIFVRSGSTWSQQAYIKAAIIDANDVFGSGVGLSGDGSTLVVSAPQEDSVATGIDGNAADNTASDAGAVYVFERTGTTWAQTAYVKGSNTEANDYFGSSVAIAGDGNTFAVGAKFEESAATTIDGDQTDNSSIYAGAAYVFVRAGTSWAQQAYIKGSHETSYDNFGRAVALAADGSTLVVGARGHALNAGAAYMFGRTGTTWTEQAFVQAPQPQSEGFGDCVAIDPTGTVAVIGASYHTDASTTARQGAAFVFTRAGSTWSFETKLLAPNPDVDDYFGSSVAATADGTIVIGAGQESSAATGLDGNQSDNSANNAGAAYMFDVTRTLQHYIKASNTDSGDLFGGEPAPPFTMNTAALSADGATLAVGARKEASGATGVDGDQADNSLGDSGAVYVFRGL